MRARGLIVVAVIAGLVHVYAEYSLRPLLAGVAGAFALAALAAYAYLTGRPWPVAAVAAALTVAVLLPVFWYERPNEYGWMSYAPLNPQHMPDDLRGGMLHAIEAALIRYRWVGLAILSAAVLLVLAARRWARSRERSGRIMITAAAVAVLMIGVELYTIWDLTDGHLGDVLVWAWPALLAAFIFFGAAVYAGEAIGAVGGALLGMWTLALADTTARQVPALAFYGEERTAVFLQPGLSYSVTTHWSLSDPWAAAYGVILLVGIGLLVVVGPLRQRTVDRVAG
jgi:hypothetical protein